MIGKKKIEWKDLIQKTEAFLEDLLIKKAPGLGKKAKEGIVSFLPWIALIFGLIGVLGSFSGLGATALVSPFLLLAGRRFTLFALVSMILSLLQSGLELFAVPALLKKAKKGWRLLFYSSLIGAVASLISFSGFGLVIVLLGLYFLFQVKEYYR